MNNSKQRMPQDKSSLSEERTIHVCGEIMRPGDVPGTGKMICLNFTQAEWDSMETNRQTKSDGQ